MLKDIINRIKIKLSCCCKSKCSLNEEYEYYTNKPKNFLKEVDEDIEDIKNKIEFINK